MKYLIIVTFIIATTDLFAATVINQSAQVLSGTKIQIEVVKGSVNVSGWDKSEVRVEGEYDATDSEFVFESEDGNTRIGLMRASGNRKSDSDLSASTLTVYAPAISFLEASGISTRFTIKGIEGSVRAESVNGEIELTDILGKVEVESVNGSVNADFKQLDKDSKVSLRTTNGTVTLTISSDVDATLRADTANANIVNQFGLPIFKSKYVGRDLHGRIGTGDVKINLSSVNGVVHINRNDAGGIPSPVINLLKPPS